jgi:hypothetical protein
MVFISDRIFVLNPLFSGYKIETNIKASQLIIKEIDINIAIEANEAWHSQLPKIEGLGFGDIRLAFGALYKEGIYGIAIWTRAVASNRLKYDSFHILELRRLAMPSYAPKYTATRMLGKMAKLIKLKYPNICKLLSYQTTDVHTGTIYKAANWQIDNIQNEYQEWTNRPARKIGQNLSPKIRWKYDLRNCNCDENNR